MSELAPQHHEHTPEINSEARERSLELYEKLKRNPERYNQKEAHEQAEKARKEALHEALHSKEQGKEKRTHQAERHNASGIITAQDRNIIYKETMDRVRRELPRSTRSFSKFIHQPMVEKASDAIGNTIARPNAILAGSITAFVSVLAVYSYAKFTGFSLQGSETIVAFLAGWIVGIMYDFFRRMITGRT